jgi:hypothetical protein
MICERYKMESGVLEERLISIFAAIECGSPEALLWLLPLEGLPEETLRGFRGNTQGRHESP